MTDSEIVKALECCGTTKGYCRDCPLNDIEDIQICEDELVTEAYRLINRQRAEIEKTKSEAVREFAEKLKERSFECPITATFGFGTEWFKEAVSVIDIDKLVKEMAEESDE